jgi:branched-chain amino acid transport system substrate-binding protein
MIFPKTYDLCVYAQHSLLMDITPQAKEDASNTTSVSRRAVLGTLTSAGALSIAGCAGDSGGSVVNVGGLAPLSGPYGAQGQDLEAVMNLAVQLAEEEGDTGDFDINLQVEDTQGDPATGRRRAQEMIENDIDMIFGTFAANVENSVVNLAMENDIPTFTGAASREFYLEGCEESHFSISANPYNQSFATLSPLLEQDLGSSVYTIAADYSWGQNHRETIESEITPEYGVDYLGNTFTQLGQGDFSQALTAAEESGADIVYCALAGGDHAQCANQIGEFGLFDEGIRFAFPFSGLNVAQGINPSVITNENLFLGIQWYWETETEDSDAFVSAYRSEYDTVPTANTGLVYGTYRTALNAVGEANSTAMEDIRSVIVDQPLAEQLWGTGEAFRGCNQALVYPPLLVQGRPEDEWNEDQTNLFEVFNKPEEPSEFYRSCEETGCEL